MRKRNGFDPVSEDDARMLDFEDEESGLRIKRLWSFYDPTHHQRFYADILEMPEDRRRKLIRQYARFLKQLKSVRKAMSDYFAGQQFFDFYPGEPEDDEELASERVTTDESGSGVRG